MNFCYFFSKLNFTNWKKKSDCSFSWRWNTLHPNIVFTLKTLKITWKCGFWLILWSKARRTPPSASDPQAASGAAAGSVPLTFPAAVHLPSTGWRCRAAAESSWPTRELVALQSLRIESWGPHQHSGSSYLNCWTDSHLLLCSACANPSLFSAWTHVAPAPCVLSLRVCIQPTNQSKSPARTETCRTIRRTPRGAQTHPDLSFLLPWAEQEKMCWYKEEVEQPGRPTTKRASVLALQHMHTSDSCYPWCSVCCIWARGAMQAGRRGDQCLYFAFKS